MNITATLRKKTERRLDQASCQTLRDVLSDILMLTCEEMDILIWDLTYDPIYRGTKLGFTDMTTEKAVTIRAEIVNFYREYNPDWKYGHLYTPTTEQEKALLKSLGGDTYAYDRVMQQLECFIPLSSFRHAKLLQCLCSTRQPSQFGGLRYLGFNLEESRFLNPCANAAGEVFESLLTAA